MGAAAHEDAARHAQAQDALGGAVSNINRAGRTIADHQRVDVDGAGGGQRRVVSGGVEEFVAGRGGVRDDGGRAGSRHRGVAGEGGDLGAVVDRPIGSAGGGPGVDRVDAQQRAQTGAGDGARGAEVDRGTGGAGDRSTNSQSPGGGRRPGRVAGDRG